MQKHSRKSTASTSLQSSSQDLPMSLILTRSTPSTLIRGISLKRQSTGTLPTSAPELCEEQQQQEPTLRRRSTITLKKKRTYLAKGSMLPKCSSQLQGPGLCFGNYSLLWQSPFSGPGSPAQLLSHAPFEAIKKPFNLVVSNCDTHKMSTSD